MPSTTVPINPLRSAAAGASRGNHRVTTSPRFRSERGALWLGLGLCLMTLFVLHRTDAP